MLKTLKALKPLKATRGAATCELIATFAMMCPLCQVTVPAHTIHRCVKESK